MRPRRHRPEFRGRGGREEHANPVSCSTRQRQQGHGLSNAMRKANDFEPACTSGQADWGFRPARFLLLLCGMKQVRPWPDSRILRMLAIAMFPAYCGRWIRQGSSGVGVAVALPVGKLFLRIGALQLGDCSQRRPTGRRPWAVFRSSRAANRRRNRPNVSRRMNLQITPKVQAMPPHAVKVPSKKTMEGCSE